MSDKKIFSPWPIVGHQRIIKSLQQVILSDNISHAYLFLGPTHIGKGTVAKVFAQALQCVGQSKIPCLKCQSCKLIEKKTHPDTMILTGEENIKIEQIRDLQHFLNLKPLDAPYKICIIEDAQRFTLQSANCLLKSLEEPPPRSILILTSSSLNYLLPTISSRCQIIKFQPVSPLKIKQELIKRGTEEELATTFCLLSCGKPGIAFNMVTQPQILEKQITLINELIQLSGKSHLRKINFAQNLIKSSQKDDFLNIESIMDFWLTWFRDLLLIKKHCDDLVVNFIQKENLIRQAQNYNTKQIESFIFKVSQTKEDLRQNINPKLAIENLIFCISQNNS